MSEPALYRINDLEVDVGRACLRRGGLEIHLKPKSFRLLVHFLQERDRLVTKDELMELFWKDTPVTDEALTQCIAELRKALGDSPRNPAYLKTVPRLGYRFVGTVLEGDDPPAAPREPLAHPMKSGARRPMWIAAGALLAVSLGAAAIWRVSHGTASVAPGKRQVAILRFENLSGEPALDWLRAGLPDMLSTTLSRSKAFELLSGEQVNSRVRVSPGNGAAGDVERARATRASIAIAGSFSKLGDSMRVDARASDVQTGAVLAAEHITVARQDQLLAQVDFLAARLAARLAPQSRDQDQRGLSSLMTDNLEAYRYYSMGVDRAEAYRIPEAIALLEKALSLDPGFVMAQARIGYTNAVLGADLRGGRPYLEKAFRSASRLTEKDRQHILAWYAIANQDYDTAIRRYTEIIAAYPGEEEAYFRLAALLRGESRHEEALDLLRQANSMEPEDPKIYNALASVYSEMGRHAEAIENASRYVTLLPSDPNVYDSLGLGYQLAGRHESALDAYGKALELSPSFEVATFHRSYLYAEMGRVRDGVRESLRLTSSGESDRVRRRAWEQAAWIHWRFKQLKEARRESEQSVQFAEEGVGDWTLPHLLASAPLLGKAAVPGRKLGRGAEYGVRSQLLIQAEYDKLQGRPRDALEKLHQLLRVRTSWSEPATFEDALAEELFQTGRVDESIAEYERALRVFPGMALARFNLAQAYQRRGRAAEARTQFQQFLELWKTADPDLPQVIEARRQLAR